MVNAPAHVEAYRRLAAAVGKWNAYSAPQLEDGDVDELEAVLRRQARREL